MPRRFLPPVALSGVFLLSWGLEVDQVSKLPLCLFRWGTHLDCPGCGLTRSFISLSHGHFLDAIRWNAVGPVIYFLFILYLFRSLVRLLRPAYDFSIGMHRGSLSYRLFFFLFWGQWVLKLWHPLNHYSSDYLFKHF